MSTKQRKVIEPRRRLPAAERRELIEQAALAVFTERGYHGASIDEIARRAGVSPPVIYDHFASKLDLHKRLLERTRDELLAMWRATLTVDLPQEQRIPHALEAWATYVQEHPYAPRMFFVETTGDPAAQAVHREVTAESRRQLGAILAREPGADRIADSADPVAMEMAAEVIRAGLTGLAIWWADHPEVAREQIVATAINAMWIGFERVRRGEGVHVAAARSSERRSTPKGGRK